MPTRKRLGKGLGALLGESAVQAAREDTDRATGSGLRTVDVSHIVPNRFQPRHTFDEQAIEELAASIAEKGILQPLIVTPRSDADGWELISGERRWRAAQRAGLAAVPVIVREVDEREMLELALVENLQREDLDPIDEADGYRQLLEEFGLTQAELARRVGKSRPAVSNALRLLELPESVRTRVKGGELSAGHARTLLGLEDRSRIEAVAKRAVDKGLSVRALERLVKRENAADGEEPVPDREDEAAELERARIEEALQRSLGTRVRLQADRRGKGRIEIAFYSFEDLERLVSRLGG